MLSVKRRAGSVKRRAGSVMRGSAGIFELRVKDVHPN